MAGDTSQGKGPTPHLVVAKVFERTRFFAVLALLHGVEELVVVLGGTKLVQQEFGGFQLVHAEQQLSENPYLGKDVGGDQEFLATCSGAIYVQRGIEPFLGHAAI